MEQAGWDYGLFMHILAFSDGCFYSCLLDIISLISWSHFLLAHVSLNEYLEQSTHPHHDCGRGVL
jgi:hypothetical protein